MNRSAWRHLWTAADIRNRLLITAGILVLYRAAAHVPVPGVDRAAIDALLTNQSTGGFLAILDLLSGGAVSNFSLLAMGVYPYITAQIILQLLVPIIPALQARMEEDPREGRRFMERWTYILAIPMSALQAFAQIQTFNNVIPGVSILPNFGFTIDPLSTVTTIVTMTAGTMFAIWLGEMISEYGIRNQGLSLIIFSGIVARLPQTVVQLWADEQTRFISLAIFVALLFVTVFVIVFVTQGRRNVPVMYPGRRMGYRQSMPVRGKLPLLVNMAGMIPIIFAQAILSFPALIAGFFIGETTPEFIRNFAFEVQRLFGNSGSWVYILTMFIMVVAFTFFYTDVLFQQQNYGDNLKRVGARVQGITPGKKTQDYLNKVLRRITLPGALMLGAVAVLPYIVGSVLSVAGAGANGFFFLGSGLLIVVGVVKETFFGLETELKLRGYDDALLVR